MRRTIPAEIMAELRESQRADFDKLRRETMGRYEPAPRPRDGRPVTAVAYGFDGSGRRIRITTIIEAL
jgi:hypothetical protein